MQLGTLINRLQDEDIALGVLVDLADLALFARVADMSARRGETAGQYVAASVSRFVGSADDTLWLGIISDIERATEPGHSALRRMLVWALEVDSMATAGRTATLDPAQLCTHGTGGDTCHDPG